MIQALLFEDEKVLRITYTETDELETIEDALRGANIDVVRMGRYR